MKFERTEHNFGTIKEEIGAVTTQFEFTNTGNAPLVIQRVTASCGCTTPSYQGTHPSGRKEPFPRNIPLYVARVPSIKQSGFTPMCPIRSYVLTIKET